MSFSFSHSARFEALGPDGDIAFDPLDTEADFEKVAIITGAGSRITVSTTPPANPQIGDIWIDTN